MSARSRMTHRCRVLRSVSTGSTSRYNKPVGSSERAVSSSLPCYWQAWPSRSGDLIQDGDKILALTVSMMRFPVDSDVRVHDIVQNVKDRRGRSVRDGRMIVQSITPKVGYNLGVVEEYR